MTEQRSDPSFAKLLTWAGGILGTLIAAGIIGILAATGSMQNRLTDIEATMRENKAEREAQIADLRARVGRLEDERAYRNERSRERKERPD